MVARLWLAPTAPCLCAQSAPRNATVQAYSDEVICASIDQHTFTTLLGGSLDLLKRSATMTSIRAKRVDDDDSTEGSLALERTGTERIEEFMTELKAGGAPVKKGRVLAAQIEALLATGMPSVSSLAGEMAMGKTHLLTLLRKK